MTLQVRIKAMKDDAALWDGVAGVLKGAADAAAGLDLTEQDLSFASVSTGVLGSYNRIQSKAERLLREGEATLTKLADRLLEVATAYETDDQTAARDLAGVWVPKP